MVFGTIPKDHGVLTPVTALLIELSDKITDEQKDGIRVGVRLAQCDEALSEVIEGKN